MKESEIIQDLTKELEDSQHVIKSLENTLSFHKKNHSKLLKNCEIEINYLKDFINHNINHQPIITMESKRSTDLMDLQQYYSNQSENDRQQSEPLHDLALDTYILENLQNKVVDLFQKILRVNQKLGMINQQIRMLDEMQQSQHENNHLHLKLLDDFYLLDGLCKRQELELEFFKSVLYENQPALPHKLNFNLSDYHCLLNIGIEGNECANNTLELNGAGLLSNPSQNAQLTIHRIPNKNEEQTKSASPILNTSQAEREILRMEKASQTSFSLTEKIHSPIDIDPVEALQQPQFYSFCFQQNLQTSSKMHTPSSHGEKIPIDIHDINEQLNSLKHPHETCESSYQCQKGSATIIDISATPQYGNSQQVYACSGSYFSVMKALVWQLFHSYLKSLKKYLMRKYVGNTLVQFVKRILRS
ncbi:hypothetical protein HDV02_001342 [Globomyces sp. JEL0801]|nr:hypothetical protein HDV02_001342 [Globomyces sp. JEL0801]